MNDPFDTTSKDFDPEKLLAIARLYRKAFYDLAEIGILDALRFRAESKSYSDNIQDPKTQAEARDVFESLYTSTISGIESRVQTIKGVEDDILAGK